MTDKKKDEKMSYETNPNVCMETIANIINSITKGRYGFFVIVAPVDDKCAITQTKCVGNIVKEDTLRMLKAEVARLEGTTPSLDLTGMDPEELDNAVKNPPQ